jgi:hypothetical protein
MNIQFRDRPEQAPGASVKTAIADCDIHPARATPTELYPYLAKRAYCRPASATPTAKRSISAMRRSFTV